ncbi:MAG: response regulator transcription factor [Planctomycetes bacterium]|nr:response regulator transcription factor [Planctomycetota bacterium]
MRILVVEDEPDLSRALRQALEEEGFACDVATDGETAAFDLESWDYDAVCLDLMLPGCDGRTLLARLRERKPTPVLVLTARDALDDKVALLDAGADDYLTKPFELAELIARLRALIRRAANRPEPALAFGEVRVDTVARAVTRRGRPVALSPKEYAIVEYLARHRGELVTRTMIYGHVYDEREDTLSNVVDVYVSNIRRKLGRDFVRTRRGAGYIVDA